MAIKITQRNKIGVYIMWLKIKILQWNKNGVYIMRLKKITWLQTCFLGDVRVIWCNSLGNSHFQTYVMNNVEIVIDYYLHIISHVSHAITWCTHYTSYSMLNLVHEIVCAFGLAIQYYFFYGVWWKICLRVGKNCVFDD